MPSKTFVPAFKAHVGEWEYYLCLMSYAQVAREISFAYELGVNKDLGSMIQRGIGVRTSDIREYLLNNDRRFLGALIVAVWGGEPDYIPLQMADNDEQGVLAGVDREFGVLTFDGTHQFFALDGQHRLRAIKDAVKKKPELGAEDIGVIVVPHFNTDEGKQLTRRLFTNINRNAVKTSKQEDIALDEDDGFAITTRRLLDDHPFVGVEGTVQVFSKQGSEGELTLAQRSINQSQSAWSTISLLYDMVQNLGWDLDGTMHRLRERATDAVLDQSYQTLAIRLAQLLAACGDLASKYTGSGSGKELRAPKGHENDGHAFMRPVVQVAVVRAVRHVVQQGLLTWDEALARLSALDWKISSAPFNAVWQFTPDAKTQGKMIAGKDNTNLLFDLLVVHLAPTSKAQVERALRGYRQLRGTKYPITTDTLAASIVAALPSTATEPSQPAPSTTVSLTDESDATTPQE